MKVNRTRKLFRAARLASILSLVDSSQVFAAQIKVNVQKVENSTEVQVRSTGIVNQSAEVINSLMCRPRTINYIVGKNSTLKQISPEDARQIEKTGFGAENIVKNLLVVEKSSSQCVSPIFLLARHRPPLLLPDSWSLLRVTNAQTGSTINTVEIETLLSEQITINGLYTIESVAVHQTRVTATESRDPGVSPPLFLLRRKITGEMSSFFEVLEKGAY